ncbi:MAG: glycoside hydrolase family 3 N-terminal domain-containing protein [Chthoniobacteraceae bacterium]|nr:glycoside hydrolase family 3 N-terminal domain-containing protein [Chthoniobacteraceae bacterium]
MSSQPLYRNAALPLEDRLNDLLGRMTLEEKIGQLMMLDARSYESDIKERGVGSFLHIRESDRAIDLSLQSRLGIPVLIAEDCIHGHALWKGATVYPTQMAMACSWNPELLGRVARATAAEVAATGIHWTFSPVLCLTRDLRWGRVGETFGEDPHLIAELASAMIAGYQGRGLDDPEGILATAKHFAGYSETQGGRDASEADISRRKLRSYFLPPFEQAARAGCMTFMTGYQSMEGVPSTANRWLLREVLKEEWGFGGILVTDWDNAGRLVREQKVCATFKHAAALAVKSGNDVMMTTPEFFEGAREAVRGGLMTEADIDEPCRRVLSLKFKMGLFENPRRSNPAKAREVLFCSAHRELNLEAARQSIVLLKNDGVLPLAPEGIRRLAVIGPNADNDLEQLGDWSLGASQFAANAGKQPREHTVTVLDGLRRTAPEGCQVVYAPGCSGVTHETDGIAGAVALAARSDAAVVVVGDCLEYIGEVRSTATLELQGAQLELLEKLRDTGTPLIIVLINSKPLVLPRSIQNAAAIVETFNPGMEGGTALAEILWGKVNPSGKLCVSFPRHVGQQPVFYSQVRGQHGHRYADLTQEPLFPFGFGLSYTTFRYGNLRVLTPGMRRGEPVELEVDVTNTGGRAGDEIAQVYVSDDVTSATWVDLQLKAFRRITLERDETRTLRFSLPFEAFSLVNADGHRVVEPGQFHLLVGGSSRIPDLLQAVCVLDESC